jgi:hypothetical protein
VRGSRGEPLPTSGFMELPSSYQRAYALTHGAKLEVPDYDGLRTGQRERAVV